jgi:hypothetical protein
LVKKYYGTRRSLIVFKRTCHWALARIRINQLSNHITLNIREPAIKLWIPYAFKSSLLRTFTVIYLLTFYLNQILHFPDKKCYKYTFFIQFELFYESKSEILSKIIIIIIIYLFLYSLTLTIHNYICWYNVAE